MNRIAFTFFLIAINPLISPYCYGQEIPLSLYGYFDFVGRDFLEREFPNGAIEDPPPTFTLLRTHILLNSALAENWQAFINIRFQSGADLGASGRGNKGQIEILEGWFEYRHRDWLRIRGGEFLAPFGYFNTRKFQSPIFSTVVLPLMYEEEFLRRAAAGTIIPPPQNLQVTGELRSGKARFGYHLYLGNGSVTDENNLDVDANKSHGARIWIEPPNGNLIMGASFHTEEGTFAIRPHLDIGAMMMKSQTSQLPITSIVPILPVVTESERRRTLGADIRYFRGNTEIRGEFVKTWVSELSLIDASTISDTIESYHFDNRPYAKTFYFVNLNHTFFEKLTPFFETNVFTDPRHFVFRNELRRLTLGLAFRPNYGVVIKTEFHNHLFGNRFNKKPTNFKSFGMIWVAVSVFFN